MRPSHWHSQHALTATHHSTTLLLGTRAAFGTRAAALAPAPAGLHPRPDRCVPGQVPATTLATADIKVDLIEYGHPGVDDRRLNQLLSAAMLFPRQAAPHHVIGASQQGRPRGGGRRVPRDDDRLVLWFGRLRRPTPHPTARAALFAPAHYHRTHRASPHAPCPAVRYRTCQFPTAAGGAQGQPQARVRGHARGRP